MDVYECKNPLLYEFWTEQQRLWIGQKDMDTISWKEGKYHLGSVSNLNYGEGYIFDTLLELLQKSFIEWFSN